MIQDRKNLIRGPKPIVSKDLSDAVEKVIDDALDAGLDFSDFENETTLNNMRGQNKRKQEELDNLVNLKQAGSDIPGQSLVNNPENPYPWESPAEISNPRNAINFLIGEIIKPDAAKNILKSISNGASVMDVTGVVLYSNFIKGKINPDVMLLAAEPIAYTIMAMAERAELDYNIEVDDLDLPYQQENDLKNEEFLDIAKKIKSGEIKSLNDIEKNPDIEKDDNNKNSSLLQRGEV